MINLEESFKKYQEKIELVESDREHLKTDVFLQAKIEAHLELLCVLGLMDQLVLVELITKSVVLLLLSCLR